MSFAADACYLSLVLLAVLFEGARQRTTSDVELHFFITCHLLRRWSFGGYGHHAAVTNCAVTTFLLEGLYSGSDCSDNGSISLASWVRSLRPVCARPVTVHASAFHRT